FAALLSLAFMASAMSLSTFLGGFLPTLTSSFIGCRLPTDGSTPWPRGALSTSVDNPPLSQSPSGQHRVATAHGRIMSHVHLPAVCISVPYGESNPGLRFVAALAPVPSFTAVLRLFTGRVCIPLWLITGSCYQVHPVHHYL